MSVAPSADELRAAFAGNPALQRSNDDHRIDVIVPVFNALERVARCLESIARHTHTPFRLFVINDGSPDPDVAPFLAGINGATECVRVIDHEENRGFVTTVNEGLTFSSVHDVVLLNSDTRVTHDWLSKLAGVAAARSGVATVTPLTNNGTLCSIPVPFEENEIPDGYDVDSFGRLVEDATLRIHPEAPTGVGFCMLITRAALDRVGHFDADAFPRGYGEENDFCQRAIRAGLVNLIADDTFVFHEGGVSFGEATRTLLEHNLREVARRYPNYLHDVDAFGRSHPLRIFHTYLKRCVAAGRSGDEGIRVLHVLHEGGGTEKHARDLAATDNPDILSYLCRSNGWQLSVEEFSKGQWLRTLTFPIRGGADHLGLEGSRTFTESFATACWALRINLIHVHHLKHNSVTIADVAASLNIPYVMTLHDYYMLCPTYTLLTSEGGVCDECRTGRPGRNADKCMKRIGKSGRDLITYQIQSEAFLQGARALFAPNTSVVSVMATRFPELAARVRVIEHGYHDRLAESAASGAAAPDTPGNELHVAVIGGLEQHKGLGVVRALLRANRDDRLVFHLYGTTPDPDIGRLTPDVEGRLDGSRFVYHGPYDSNEVVTMLTRDGIHIGLQPAIWPETFSYTLSEFADANIPVIAGDLGAQGDRVRRHNLGWTVPDIRNVEAVRTILYATVDDRSSLGAVRGRMNRVAALRLRRGMWSDYVNAYMEVMSAGPETGGGGAHVRDDTAPSREYVAYLAMQLTEASRPNVETSPPAGDGAEIRWLRERLRSPRHRIADRAANAVQKIPVLWPMIASVTEAFLRWERRRREHRDSRSVSTR